MKVALSSYDPAWAASFDQMEARVREALGDDALAVEHVGSTAVPGLSAKPVVDMLLVVADSTDESTYTGPLRHVGFEFHLREPDWHEHRLFTLADPPANLHVFSSGCPEVQRMLRFRDLLRSDGSARETYESRKRELALGEWASVQDYADAKSSVVEGLLASG